MVSLLRDIVATARANDRVGDVSRLTRLIELYGLHLQEQAAGTGPGAEAVPVAFADFVTDEGLIARAERRRGRADGDS